MLYYTLLYLLYCNLIISVEKRCGETTEAYMTYFTNPRHPMPTAGFGECKLTVSPMHESICQYRVDFDKLSMTGPDKSSDCVTDTVAVTGGSPVPRMCGELTGQHCRLLPLDMDDRSLFTFAYICFKK